MALKNHTSAVCGIKQAIKRFVTAQQRVDVEVIECVVSVTKKDRRTNDISKDLLMDTVAYAGI